MPDYNRVAAIYWFSLVALGLVCLVAALTHTVAGDTKNLLTVIAGVGAALFSSALPIRIPGVNGAYTLTNGVTFFVLLSAGPWPAVLVAAADGVMGSWRETSRLTNRLATVASFSLSMSIVGWLWSVSYSVAITLGLPAIASLVLLTIVMGVIDTAISTAAVSSLLKLKGSKVPALWSLLDPLLWSVIATTLVAALLYVAAQHAGAEIVASTGLVTALLLLGLHLQANRYFRLMDQQEARAHALLRAANQDSLTGLPNRRAFREAVERALERIRSDPERRVALLYLDLDRFKHINDTLGHQAGDQLLVAAAHRMQQQLRTGDLLARLGGDEFSILIEPLLSDNDALVVASRIVDALGQPYELAGQQVVSRVSIGVRFAEGSEQRSVDEIIHDADIAMFTAKSAGRGCFRVFSRDLLETKDVLA